MVYRCENKPDRCPFCASRRVATIIYGPLVFSELVKRSLDEEKIVLGGHCIANDAPQWRCLRCGESVYQK